MADATTSDVLVMSVLYIFYYSGEIILVSGIESFFFLDLTCLVGTVTMRPNIRGNKPQPYYS